jgi:hypothetical protein
VSEFAVINTVGKMARTRADSGRSRGPTTKPDPREGGQNAGVGDAFVAKRLDCSIVKTPPSHPVGAYRRRATCNRKSS